MMRRAIDFGIGILEMAFGVWMLKHESAWYIGHIFGIALCFTGCLAVLVSLTTSKEDREEYKKLK